MRAAIPAAFETDDYRARRREIEAESTDRQQKALEDLRARAKQENIALLQTPDGGLIFAPMRNGEPIACSGNNR
ncbi:MAG: AAA family ATPase [Verrucomicrobia bacterium]|nr:AAA family ATPase [Verrucomicrobiota bacterium]